MRHAMLAALVIVIMVGCERGRVTPNTAPTPVAPEVSRAPAAAPATTRRVHVFVSGQVQGVGFRAFTRNEADKLSLTGWVKNLADGRVEAVIEGPAEKVARLIEVMKRGPEVSHVDKLDVADEPPTGEFKRFDIRQ